MPQLTTKTENNQQATTTQRKPTLATQLAVRNEQIENSQTFDSTKQFVNTSIAPQTRTQTDTVRSREINNQQNAENQVLGRDKRKRRSIDSDPEFASIHTIMIAAARAAAQTESNQQDIGPQKGLEVSGVEVSNFAREVVKEMANRGMPLNLTTMQDALGQALETIPGLNTEKAEAGLLAALGKEVEKASEIEARIKLEVKERIIAPIFRAVPDPFDPRHQELLQQQLALVSEVAPELNAKQLKGLVESVYNSSLKEQTEQIVGEKDTEKRANLLADMESIRAVPYFILQQKAPWLFKNPETASAILQLKQESIATDLELTAGRLVKGQDGAAFDQTWRQLSTEAELTYSDVFTKEFRSSLDLRRGKVWENAERKVRLETEVERTLIEVLDNKDLLDAAYQTRKAALAEKFEAQGQAEQFARIVQRIEVAYIEKAVNAAAKDPFNPEQAFGLTMLQGTREQFGRAFPHLLGTRVEETITSARRRAGVNMAFEGVNLSGLRELPADNLSPIIAVQEAQAYLLLPALRSDSMFKYNLRAEFEGRLANEREITRAAMSLLQFGEKDPVAAAKEINPALADGIVEKYRDLARQRDEIARRTDAFELQSRKDTVSGRLDKLASLRLALAKEFPEIAKEQGVFEGAIIKAIDRRRTDKGFEFAYDHPGQMSIDQRVDLFIGAQIGPWYALGGGTEEVQLIQALSGLSPYGVTKFRERLAANLTGRTSPEAVLTGELDTDGTDGAYRKIATALLNADHVKAGEELVCNAWKLGKEEVERFIADSSPEHRAEVAKRIKQNYHLTMLSQSMEAAAAGDKLSYQRFMLAFKEDPVSTQTYALRQTIDSRDAMGITIQMRSLSAADASAEKLRQAIMSGDRERIIASVADIRPEHLGMMDKVFRGGLGQRLALALPNDPALPALAQRLGVKVDNSPSQLDNKDFTINPMVPAVEYEFSQSFKRDWRAAAQDTEDPKLRMAAAGDEVALALTNFKETVGSFELGLLGNSGLRDTEVSRLINTLTTVSERGQMGQFKAAFEKDYEETLESFITGRLYINSSNSKEWLIGGQAEILRSLALKVVSGENLTVADKLGIGLVLGGYTKSDVPAMTASVPPEQLVSATKELAQMIKQNGYSLRTVDIEGLSARLDSASTPEAQRQAASDLLFALYEFRYESSLADREKLPAKHAFRGQADTLEQIKRIREIAEYNRGRVVDDNSFNPNPLELFGAPSVAINSIASSDDQLLIDATFAATTAANLQKRFEMSESETKAFEVHSRLGSKETLTAEEEREARKADELIRAYAARIGGMTPEELALLRSAQSRLDAASGSYFAMRNTTESMVKGVTDVVVVIAVTVASSGSMTFIAVQSAGWSFVTRSAISSSVLGDDYTDDMRLGDMKHAAIMGVSQGGSAAAMTFFKGLASKGIAAAGNKIPAFGQALQTAKKAEDVVASVGAKAAQLEANATAAAARQAAGLANSVNASGGAVTNLVTQSIKSGFEWGAMGGTAGAISSVLNNSTNLEFWRHNGLAGGLVRLATQAGEDAVASAIISGKMGFAVPATVLISRSVWGLRNKINATVAEARSEFWSTLETAELPTVRPAAQPSAAKPQVVAEPQISTPHARPTSQPTAQPQLTPEMADKLRTGRASEIVDEVGYSLNSNGTPRAPQPKQPTAPEAPAKVATENPDLAGKWSQFEDDFYRMMGEPKQTAKVQSTPVKDAPKPPSDGGAPSGKSAEAVNPISPKDTGRIRGETPENTSFKPETDGGSVALMEPPTAPVAKPKAPTERITDSSRPTIKPEKLDGQDLFMADEGLISIAKPTTKLSTLDDQQLFKGENGFMVRPTTRPSLEPAPQRIVETTTPARVEPSIKPTTAAPELAPSVQPQPILSPSVSTLAPGMKPSFADAASTALGSETALLGKRSPAEGTSPSTSMTPSTQPQPQPQPAQRPGPATATKPNRKDDENGGLAVGIADEPPPGTPAVSKLDRYPDFDPAQVGRLIIEGSDSSNPQLTTLEKIEIENKQKEKKTKVITHYTRRRRRADGTEYDGDFDIAFEADSQLDEKGNPIKNGSRVVTGDRIVNVQIGTTVTRSED
jgi:hypothetical protein